MSVAIVSVREGEVVFSGAHRDLFTAEVFDDGTIVVRLRNDAVIGIEDTPLAVHLIEPDEVIEAEITPLPVEKPASGKVGDWGRRQRMIDRCPEGHMTREDAALELGCGESQISNLLRGGRLQGTEIGQFLYVTKESVEHRKANHPGTGDKGRGQRILDSRPEGYLTSAEAAAELGLKTSSITWLIREKKIESVRTAGFRYVSKVSVEAEKARRESKESAAQTKVDLRQPPEGYVTAQEAAAELGMGIKNVGWLIHRSKRLESVKVGRYRFVLKASVEAEKARRAGDTKPETASAALTEVGPESAVQGDVDLESPPPPVIDEAFLDRFIDLKVAAKVMKLSAPALWKALEAEGIHTMAAGGRAWIARKDWDKYWRAHPPSAPAKDVILWRPECVGCHYRRTLGPDKMDCSKFGDPMTAPVADDGDCVFLGVRKGDPPRPAARSEEATIADGQCSRCRAETEIIDGRCGACGCRVVIKQTE